MEKSLYMDADDVEIKPVEAEICDCEQNEVVQEVWLDIRHGGMKVSIFRGCAECCKEVAGRLKESLEG